MRIQFKFRLRLTNQVVSSLRLCSSEPSNKNLFVRHSRVPFTVEPDLNFTEQLNDLRKIQHSYTVRKVPFSEDEILLLKKEYIKWKTLVTELEKIDANKKDSRDPPIPERGPLVEKIKALIPTVRKCLNLPNEVSQDTPTEENRLLDTLNDRMVERTEVKSHVDVMKEKNMATFKGNPLVCFLTGDGAELQIALQGFLYRKFCLIGMNATTVPHMVRRAIAEGCFLDSGGMEVDSSEEICDTTAPLQLVGNSLPAYCALFCRKVVTTTPVTLFSASTKYEPRITMATRGDGLFGSWQYPAASIFSITADQISAGESVDNLRAIFCNIFDTLELRVSVEQVCGASLTFAEQSKIRFGYGRHTIGWISTYGTFLSRRLRIYHEKESEKKYAHIVFAELNILSLLALAIETEKYDAIVSAISDL